MSLRIVHSRRKTPRTYDRPGDLAVFFLCFRKSFATVPKYRVRFNVLYISKPFFEIIYVARSG